MWWHIQDYAAATEMKGLHFPSSERCQNRLCRKVHSSRGQGLPIVETLPPICLFFFAIALKFQNYRVNIAI